MRKRNRRPLSTPLFLGIIGYMVVCVIAMVCLCGVVLLSIDNNQTTTRYTDDDINYSPVPAGNDFGYYTPQDTEYDSQVECTSDSECSSRQRCRDNQCVTVECTTDSHCGNCERCSGNTCVDCGEGPYGCYC